jgi:hypothetical protein
MRRLPKYLLAATLVTITACAALPTATLAASDWIELFDGKTLDGWSGNPRFWSVQDGVITGQTTPDNPTKGNTFLVWKGGTVGDFELTLDFRLVGGNSGIQYRSKEMDKWVIGGYQADFDAGGKFSGILYEERGRGILARRGTKVVIEQNGDKKVVGKTTDEKSILAAIKKEDWNQYTIIAKGNHLIHKINGMVTVEVTDNQEDKRRMSGLLALQLHQGPPMLVQFRNIRWKKCDENGKTPE